MPITSSSVSPELLIVSEMEAGNDGGLGKAAR
jgi:hypothetical protein